MNFNVTVNRDDGKTITIGNIEAVDAWKARTMVWFRMPPRWADAHEVSYVVAESREESR